MRLFKFKLLIFELWSILYLTVRWDWKNLEGFIVKYAVVARKTRVLNPKACGDKGRSPEGEAMGDEAPTIKSLPDQSARILPVNLAISE